LGANQHQNKRSHTFEQVYLKNVTELDDQLQGLAYNLNQLDRPYLLIVPISLHEMTSRSTRSRISTGLYIMET